eukprot:CAMPEP_0118678758 /NCGR_PEP_ID=MMETSP0800-20121206/3399_1 /TAXON_ID=210618 ORGANISM="Striatella unipunctata, Strain CCMP2910" /NCGR_SAMPLE_ID=MMETSP0800 /ASSEMBLY_ACC=CAM_ASM_000638 /LENGTH=279 /DNA_ID=CAMNT_0006574655 /DNA_START=141 /DNA_END=980 /DNA_ORIENTATION=+
MDLNEYVQYLSFPMEMNIIKGIAKNILSALQHCHSMNIVHGDIKPGNLLLCKHTDGNVRWKLCDFGLAEIAETETNQEGLCTLWYRPPELLLAGEAYKFKKTSIDIYSCALLIAETLLQHPLITGRSVLDQLNRTFDLLGSPTEENWPSWTQFLPEGSNMIKFPFRPTRTSLVSIIPRLSKEMDSLLLQMLSLEPSRRPTASSCLENDLLNQLENAYPQIPRDMDLPHVVFRGDNSKFRAAALANKRRTLLQSKFPSPFGNNNAPGCDALMESIKFLSS